ncbi:MAG: hypothetical protein AAB209_13295, partial [Bacteroidota bacterium]
YTLAGGTATSSPQMLYHIGCGDAIVPQHRRDVAADVIASAIIQNSGRMITREQMDALNFERLTTQLSFADRQEMHVAKDVFAQADLLPTLYAQARGQATLAFTGELKGIAERALRKVANNSPNAVWVSNELISRGFEGFLNGVDNDTLAAFELEHHLRQVFEHPDALIGLEAVVQGKFPQFRRRYPF